MQRLAGEFPTSLKNWWPCTEDSGKILYDVVGGMDLRGDIPAYNDATGEFDQTAGGGNLVTFSQVSPGAVRFTDDTSGNDGTTGGAASNHRVGDGIEQLAEAGEKPFIFMIYCTPYGVVPRSHLGINNVNLKQRITIGTDLVATPSTTTGISGADTDDTTNWTNLDADWTAGTGHLWSVVSDGTNSQLWIDGTAQASGVVNVHGNFSPSNAIGLSGIDAIRGFAWMIFDTLPSNLDIALSWMSDQWANNNKAFWPYFP